MAQRPLRQTSLEGFQPSTSGSSSSSTTFAHDSPDDEVMDCDNDNNQ